MKQSRKCTLIRKDMQNLKKHNIFFLPVNTGYSINGSPDCRLVKFHDERSGNGIYCSIVGNVVVPNGYGSNNNCSYISDHPIWSEVAYSISKNGSIPGIQLSSTWPEYSGNQTFVSKKEQGIQEYKNIVMDISKRKIDLFFDDLKRGIEKSIKSGFKHIQIHAAHGYIISLLIDNVFCNNYKHSQTILSNINQYFNKETESSIRISLLTGVLALDKLREPTIEGILNMPFDFIDISFGYYNINKNMIYPSSNSMLRSRLSHSLRIANANPNKKFIISGRSLYFHNESLPDNVSIGICRDLIAFPNFLHNPSEITGCDLCGQCHYYSRGESSITCGKWITALK